jgi:hypothetical protein
LCDVGDLLRREQFWFEFRKPEYNICLIAGNTSGRKHSDETKRKIGNRALGRKYPPRSKEYRQKLSLRSKGKPKPAHVINALQSGRAKRVYTEDQREQIAKSLRDAYADGRRSKVKSDDHRYKIGRAFSKLSDEEVRQIRILRADGISCREVAVRFGSNAGTVSEICTGKRYRWVQ